MKLVSIALVCTVLSAFLKDTKPEFVLPVRLCAVAMMGAIVFAFAKGRISSALDLLNKTELSVDVTNLLLKGVAVSILSMVCSSLCRENGNSSAADMLELSGRIVTVVLCLPLIEAVIKTALSFV